MKITIDDDTAAELVLACLKEDKKRLKSFKGTNMEEEGHSELIRACKRLIKFYGG